MNRLISLINLVLNEDKYMGYVLPKHRVLIRPNEKSKFEDDKYEVQLFPGDKWWKFFKTENECFQFAIGVGGAGGEDYPIYVVRGNEVVHLVFRKAELETYIQQHVREDRERKENEKPSFEYPEFNSPPKPLSWDEVSNLPSAIELRKGIKT